MSSPTTTTSTSSRSPSTPRPPTTAPSTSTSLPPPSVGAAAAPPTSSSSDKSQLQAQAPIPLPQPSPSPSPSRPPHPRLPPIVPSSSSVPGAATTPTRPTLASRRSSRFSEEPMHGDATPVSSTFVDPAAGSSPYLAQSPSQASAGAGLQQSPHHLHFQRRRSSRDAWQMAGPQNPTAAVPGQAFGGAAQGPPPPRATVARFSVVQRLSPGVGGSRGAVGDGYGAAVDEMDVDDDDEDDEEARRRGSAVAAVFRCINGVMHFAACLILELVMGTYLASRLGVAAGALSRNVVPQAITLCVFLGIDAGFDAFSVAFFRSLWPGWVLLLRLIFGVGYLAIFMAYIGIGRVFPYGYTYWGLDRGYAGPVVYLFLWLIGVWNLLHTALHRHRFGQDLRGYFVAISRPRGPSTPPASMPTSIATSLPPQRRHGAFSFPRSLRLLGRRRRRGGTVDMEGELGGGRRGASGVVSVVRHDEGGHDAIAMDQRSAEDKSVSVMTTRSAVTTADGREDPAAGRQHGQAQQVGPEEIRL